MTGIVNGKEYGEKEYQGREKQQKAGEEAEPIASAEAEEKIREQAAQLMRELSQAYTSYQDFIARHPELSLRVTQDVTQGEAADHDLYRHLRENLERAEQAPRCSHVKADGLRCGSPRMKTGVLCYAHQRMAESRLLVSPQTPRLPSMMMEDANSIQVALMEVTRALLGGQITDKTAGKLLYSLQIAASNLKRLTFHKAPEQMAVDEPVESADFRKQEAFSYEMLDQDLKLRLVEISDEVDRRLREKSDRQAACINTNEGGSRDAPEVLTPEDSKEHRGEMEIAGPETYFEIEKNLGSGRESRE
ncbi:MAG TPA: hypothetical protein VI488_11460 [Candidatus Angelobacter sp.]